MRKKITKKEYLVMVGFKGQGEKIKTLINSLTFNFSDF